MKKFIVLFIITVFIVLVLILAGLIVGVVFYKDRAAKMAVAEALTSAFPQAKVTLGSTHLDIFGKLTVKDINVTAPSRGLIFTAERTELDFYPANLTYLIRDNVIYRMLEGGALRASNIEYKDLRFTDTILQAQNVNDAQSPNMMYQGTVSIQTLLYKKIKMDEVKSEFTYADRKLNLDIYHMLFSDGMVTGTVTVKDNDGTINYTADVKLKDLKAGNLMVIMNLDKKMKMSGTWNGTVHVAGSIRKGITSITGDLVAEAPGGELIITDQQMIDNIASRVGVVKDELAQSLRRHDYKKGTMALGLDDATVTVSISLSGETGDRNFDVYLHDILE